MSRKYPKQFKLTVPLEAERSFEKFVEIAEREGKSASEIVRNFVVDYVEKHAPGNPQQRLDTIMLLGKPYRADVCGVSGCGAAPVAQAWLLKSMVPVPLCAEHLQAKQRLVDAKTWEPIITRFRWIQKKKRV